MKNDKENSEPLPGKAPMSLFREMYRTGIPLIDTQHARYAELVEKLFALPPPESEAAGRERFNEVLNEALSYAMEHFDAEEFLMRSAEYPLYEEHLAKHNEFRLQMDAILHNLDSDSDINDYYAALREWLVDWVQRQILIDDVRLARFLKAREKRKVHSE